MEKTSWSRLTPDQRRELEAVLTDPSLSGHFLSDYGDSTVPWMFGLAAGAAGAIASSMQMGGNVLGLWRLPLFWVEHGVSLHGLLYPVGFLASLAVFAWSALTWIRNHRRRGYAATSFATIRVKGQRLLLMRHASVARIEWTTHAPPGSQRFSVLRLTNAEGGTLTCTVHAGWVRTAIARIDEGRAAAKLPPIEGEDRKLPE